MSNRFCLRNRLQNPRFGVPNHQKSLFWGWEVDLEPSGAQNCSFRVGTRKVVLSSSGTAETPKSPDLEVWGAKSAVFPPKTALFCPKTWFGFVRFPLSNPLKRRESSKDLPDFSPPTAKSPIFRVWRRKSAVFAPKLPDFRRFGGGPELGFGGLRRAKVAEIHRFRGSKPSKRAISGVQTSLLTSSLTSGRGSRSTWGEVPGQPGGRF